MIGLHGLAGSGKDSVGLYLEDMYQFERAALAKPIKDAACALFGLTPEHFEDRNLKEAVIPWLGKSPRHIAQLLGTEFGRQYFGSDIWIKVAKQRLDAWRMDPVEQPVHPLSGFVLTDIRYEDEASWVRSEGGRIWHIRRPGIAPVAAHISENGIALARGDLMIENNGTLDDLYDKIDFIDFRGGDT